MHITDFGIARVWNPSNAQDTSGTPGYMAPEVMCRYNHGTAVDYFALGVIAYELMLGKRPYQGKTRKDIKDQMIAKQVSVKKADIPHGWTIEAADFINKCLQRRPANRLGVNGPVEVKQHVWFKSFNWKLLMEKKMQALFVPNMKHNNFDPKNTNEHNMTDENTKQNAQLLKKEDVQNFFSGYYFNIEEDKATKESNKKIENLISKEEAEKP